jgi:sigma-E factor negative regulatory protein RseC
MIEEFAVVTQRMDGYVMLEVERRTACGLCGQKRGCGNATWGKLLGHQSQAFLATNNIDVKVGDGVVVGIDEKIVLRTVFYLYLVPLLSMVVSALIADQLFSHDLWVALFAAIGLVAGFFWVKGHLSAYGNAKVSLSHQCHARVLRLAS